MDVLFDEFINSTGLGWETIIVRLLGAVIFSGLIGFERETRHRPAGLRTHMLVGLASAAYCLIMLEVMATMESSSQSLAMDPLRLLEAVTGGVAFLAAGMIIFSGGKVQGLTTGASLWLAAALGLGAGFGFWPLAVLSTGLALIVIRLIGLAEHAVKKHGDAEDDGAA
ncbi:MgtC/SapB family protein [Roseicitreum antarcticum]|uniref:Protein MgtC n=1 Tax=Roseicitreum antarcticum TaxID=564137 RepID=A0A1H2VGN0_9RHOB|nr:MgtC/SapB family protein [Roseicitreum antarcticum]SDW67380.1 putative Mg2+ transporter-C (MgtC) family protein [Roseicitreum antarcticum]